MLEDHDHKHAVHDFDGIIENRVTTPPVYFNVLFYGLIIWGVVFSAYYIFSGWSSEKEFNAEMSAYQQQQMTAAEQAADKTAAAAGEPEKTAAAAADQKEEIDAAGLYADHCAMCHGAEGGGGIGPDLTDPNYIYGRAHGDVASSIRDGRPNGMPGFANQLSAREIDALADYVTQMVEEPAAASRTEAAATADDQQQAADAEEKKPSAQETATAAPAEKAEGIDAAGIFAQRCAMCHGSEGAGSGVGPDLTDANYIYGKSQAEVVESIRDGRPNGMPGFGNQLSTQEIEALAEYVREL